MGFNPRSAMHARGRKISTDAALANAAARTRAAKLVLAVVAVSAAAAGGCGSPPPPVKVAQEEPHAPGFCDDKTPCPGGAPCTSDHRCGSAPIASRAPVECNDETNPCTGKGEHCENGHCVGPDPGGPGCREFGSPSFDFDSLELGATTKQTLQRLAGCLVSGSLKGRNVLLTGHCDPRGEHEYNMGLGAQRAASARDFLLTLGVPAEKVVTSSRGKLDATGTDEGSWVKDRRVDIEVR